MTRVAAEQQLVEAQQLAARAERAFSDAQRRVEFQRGYLQAVIDAEAPPDGQ